MFIFEFVVATLEPELPSLLDDVDRCLVSASISSRLTPSCKQVVSPSRISMNLEPGMVQMSAVANIRKKSLVADDRACEETDDA